MSKLIFISHITEETKLAQLFSNYIKKFYLGMFSTFVSSDMESIASGGRWIEDISSALESSVVQLILCSPQSINRPWINFEAGAAWIRKVPVIPICHSGLTKNFLPIPLKLLQACDVTNENDLKKMFITLSHALKSELPTIDYYDIISECNSFSKEYTYYSLLKNSIIELGKLYPDLLSTIKAKSSKYFDIVIPDIHKAKTIEHLETLNKMQLIAYEGNGSTITYEGIYSKVRIIFLDKLFQEDLNTILS